MNGVEAAASAAPEPLEFVMPTPPSSSASAAAATFNRATEFLQVLAKAETVKFRGYDVGFRHGGELGPTVPGGNLHDLPATALLALRG